MERMLGVDEFGVISGDEVLRTLMHRAGYRTWLTLTWICFPVGACLLLFAEGTWFVVGGMLFAQCLIGLVMFDALRWIEGVHDGLRQLEQRIVVPRRDVMRTTIIRGLLGAAGGALFSWKVGGTPDTLTIIGSTVVWGVVVAAFSYIRLKPFITASRRRT
jgi:hypothetical protein